MEKIKSIISQEPATKNQIKNKKPNIIDNANVLQGYISTSFNGGMIRPICFAPIMAGTNVYEHRLRLNLKMLTPKTPVYQKLKATVKAYFVPNKRVMNDWEKFEAQKGGASETKIQETPNLGGKRITTIRTQYKLPNSESEWAYETPYTDTDLFRDSYVSTYVPRYQTNMKTTGNINSGVVNMNLMGIFPKYEILPLRGFKAIWNDYERNKEYDEQFIEYLGNTMTEQEYLTFFPEDKNGAMKNIKRGKRQNSYYTDYRTELLGINEEYDFENSNNTLSSLIEYQKLVAESRNQAENAQLNDWDIIAKEHGSRKLTQGKVQLLGTKTFGINYNSVTQSAYNINENIQEEFQVLGEQGAYSYTEIDLPIYGMTEFVETGYVHFIIQISADTVFETAFDRQLLNVNALDRYRPELKELKDDVLYEIEKSGTYLNEETELTKITGYKRKFSEYFKLPNSINGDLMNNPFYITSENTTDINIKKTNDTEDGEAVTTTPKNTFQFFETDDKQNSRFVKKNIWQDYTDLLINRNQAIKQQEDYKTFGEENPEHIRVIGDNQFIGLGIQTITAELPIDENIKENYTTWGEM